MHTHAKAELLLLLQSLLVGNELFSYVPLPLRKHSAFAVDTKCSESFIALYQCLTISENNPGNVNEAKHKETEGILKSTKPFVKVLHPQMSSDLCLLFPAIKHLEASSWDIIH